MAPALAAFLLATGCLSNPGFECVIESNVLEVSIDGQLGTNGGSGIQNTHCDEKMAVGVGFTMTLDENPNVRGRTAVKAQLHCATASNHDGDYTTDEITKQDSIGGDWPNVTGPHVATCPDGEVVTGLSAHILGSNGGLFNSISILCSPLGPSGAPISRFTRIPVDGTGAVPPVTDARCGDGKALRGLRSISGNELDQLLIGCAPTDCANAP